MLESAGPRKERELVRTRMRRMGLIRFLGEIASFCFEEAEIYRTRWGDPQFAEVWKRRGELILTIADGLRKEDALLTSVARGKNKRDKPINKKKLPQLPFFRRR